jgi:hypothetical protein
MRLDFSSRCRSEHQTLIEARLPEGNCGGDRRCRAILRAIASTSLVREPIGPRQIGSRLRSAPT